MDAWRIYGLSTAKHCASLRIPLPGRWICPLVVTARSSVVLSDHTHYPSAVRIEARRSAGTLTTASGHCFLACWSAHHRGAPMILNGSVRSAG